ncbi:MAG TPA: polysaccharide biosynthesis/export family protein [Burkholderiales bacterium]|nr:polysaccharide biosynthesis/export family protein [Burkholderiales bacterium]
MVLLRIAVLIAAVLTLAGCESMFDGGNRPHVARTNYVVPQEYRLNSGDVVSVRVYGGDEEIRVERMRLDGSGTLVLPFGDFKVQGRTTREIETDITASVKGRLLRNPRVSVNIDEYRPFFVDGQVGRPGAYPYQPGLTVRKAITIAGGLRERASLKKIFLLPESGASPTPINVDLNTPVGPGDTINVEESFF